MLRNQSYFSYIYKRFGRVDKLRANFVAYAINLPPDNCPSGEAEVPDENAFVLSEKGVTEM